MPDLDTVPDAPDYIVDFEGQMQAVEYRGVRYAGNADITHLLKGLMPEQRTEVVCITMSGMRIPLAKIDENSGERAMR